MGTSPWIPPCCNLGYLVPMLAGLTWVRHSNPEAQYNLVPMLAGQPSLLRSGILFMISRALARAQKVRSIKRLVVQLLGRTQVRANMGTRYPCKSRGGSPAPWLEPPSWANMSLRSHVSRGGVNGGIPRNTRPWVYMPLDYTCP